VLKHIKLSSSSPFQSSHRSWQGSAHVVALEVDWDSICGLDYLNQLCTDGRVVLEAHHIVKRVFRTVRHSFVGKVKEPDIAECQTALRCDHSLNILSML
jgi:hypothetical protein